MNWTKKQIALAVLGGLLIVAAVLLVQFVIVETLKGA